MPTLGHRSCNRIDARSITCSDSRCCLRPLGGSIALGLIDAAYSFGLVFSYSNLAIVLNLYQGITQHTSELTTTEDTLHDEGIAADGHIGLVHICLEVCIWVSRRILNEATASTPYPALRDRHTHGCHCYGTYLGITIDNHRTFSCTVSATNGLTNTITLMRRMTKDICICCKR